MKMKELFNHLLTAAVAIVASGAAIADDPVYVAGAEYEVSNGWLIVKSGVGTLVAQFDKYEASGSAQVSRLVVAEGATLKLGIDDPFLKKPIMYINGTLDLNGHDLGALRLFNDPDQENNLSYDIADRRSVLGRIVNTSSTAVTLGLTSSGESHFYGTIEELPGAISLEPVNNNSLFLRGPSVTNALSSVTLNGSGNLHPETMATKYTFVFHPPANGNSKVAIGEIELTYKGKTVWTSSATGSSRTYPYAYANLIDGKANSYWQAEDVGTNYVTLTVSLGLVDGYRITPCGVATRPSGWDVYMSREKNGWKSFLIDSRHNFTGWQEGQSYNSVPNMLFASCPSGAFGTNTTVNLSGTAQVPLYVQTGAPFVTGAITGSGRVQVGFNGAIEPGDISGFTGSFEQNGTVSAPLTAEVRLSERGGTEQPISITSAQNLSVVNCGAEPVSVLLDDSRADEHLFGRLADGEEGGCLGLVKRGSGERVIETEDAAYTGPTAVHGGTLTVARARTYTARYIRITPTATYGSLDNTYPWGMNEFQLLDANGEAVAWPVGTKASKIGSGGDLGSASPTNLVDGKTSTRALFKTDSSGTYTYPPALIDTVTGVTFASYKWWSPHNNSADADRTPIAWTVEISDDNSKWTLCDSAEWAWSAADNAGKTAGWTGANSVERGPFVAGAASSSASGLNALPESLLAPAAARDTHRKISAQRFRLRVCETANPFNTNNSWGWELAEICLFRDGTRVPWPEGTTITASGSSVNPNSGSSLGKLVNNVLKADSDIIVNNNDSERAFLQYLPSYVEIDAGETLVFDSYAFVSTGASAPYPDRIPKAWMFSAAPEGSETFSALDTVGRYTPGKDYSITQSYQMIGPFDVASKFAYTGGAAGNSLGDKSPVAIDAGATLRLDTSYEKFGPLSGAGTLDLVWNAVGEINACALATFSGSVTGEGTLAVCGDAVQTFDGATLSGAKTLELNGGALAGSASFGGNDVTVAFNGGATGAALSGIGTLTVTGTVKYALPDVTGIESYSATLFAATTIPAASQTLLAAGEFVEASRNWRWRVTVTGTTVTLRGNVCGTTIMIR